MSVVPCEFELDQTVLVEPGGFLRTPLAIIKIGDILRIEIITNHSFVSLAGAFSYEKPKVDTYTVMCYLRNINPLNEEIEIVLNVFDNNEKEKALGYVQVLFDAIANWRIVG